MIFMLSVMGIFSGKVDLCLPEFPSPFRVLALTLDFGDEVAQMH